MLYTQTHMHQFVHAIALRPNMQTSSCNQVCHEHCHTSFLAEVEQCHSFGYSHMSVLMDKAFHYLAPKFTTVIWLFQPAYFHSDKCTAMTFSLAVTTGIPTTSPYFGAIMTLVFHSCKLHLCTRTLLSEQPHILIHYLEGAGGVLNKRKHILVSSTVLFFVRYNRWIFCLFGRATYRFLQIYRLKLEG